MFVEFLVVMESICVKRFGEVIWRLFNEIFKEAKDIVWEVKFFSVSFDVFWSEFVGDYELCEIIVDFGCWGDFDNVIEKFVSLCIGFFGFKLLRVEINVLGLEYYVGELIIGDFVFVYFGVGVSKVSFEG